MGKTGCNIAFFILLFLSAICYFLYFDFNKIDIPLVEKINKPVYINIKLPENKRSDFELYKNNQKIEPYIKTKNPYIIYKIENEPVYSLSYKSKIPPQDIFTVIDSNIMQGETNNKGEILTYKNIPYNSKNKVKSFTVKFLSLFYNMKNSIFSLLFFVFAFLIYLTNKEKINFKFNLSKTLALSFILVLGFILRTADNLYPLWWDELYTVTMTGNPSFPWFSIFLDPNNPPVFYILSKIWILIFNCDLSGSEPVLRLLPAIFSTLSILLLYFLIEQNISTKNRNKGYSLFVAFLFALNLYSIYTAVEYRTYSLLIFLVLALTLFLFKIKKQGYNKDFIFYGLIASIIVNTHYYGVFIVFLNFILMIFILENYKKIKFLWANIIAFISFLPWFLVSMFISGAMKTNVIPKSNNGIFQLYNIFIELFSSKITAIIVLIAFSIIIFSYIKNKKIKFNLYFYSMYIVISLLILSYLLSFIKPCIRDYYFVSIICFIPVILVSICYTPVKNKIIRFILPFIVIGSYFMGNNYIDRDMARLINIDLLYKFAYYNSGDCNSVILTPGISYFSAFYANYSKNNLNIIEIPTEMSPYDIIQTVKNDKNKIFYIKTDIYNLNNIISKLPEKYKNEYIMGNNDIVIIKAVKQ